MQENIQPTAQETAKSVIEEKLNQPQPASTQPPEAQPAPPMPAVKPDQDPDFVRKFATLTQKERELFKKERQLKEMQAKFQKYEQLEDLKSKDPFKYIKEQGIEFDSVVNAALRADEPPTVEDKVKSLEEKIAAYEKAMEEKEQASKREREQQAIDNFKKQIETQIKSDLEQYELINAQEEYETVFEVVQEHYRRTLETTGQGEVLPIEKAAQEVENYLLERAKKLLGLKKLAASQATPTETHAKQSEASMAATLTASMTPASSAPVKLPYDFSPEGIERRKREAAKLIDWKR